MADETCGLCGRPLGNVRLSRHHIVPKCRGGDEMATMHDICHDAIHRTFTEKELEQYYNTFERLLESEDLQAFVKWVRKQPPEFYNKTNETTQRRSKRWK